MKNLKKVLDRIHLTMYNAIVEQMMGCRQTARHWTLTPAFEGSNPSSPANIQAFY